MDLTVGIVDYGAGNLFSVENALGKLGCKVVTATDPGMLAGIRKIILPGVGTFPDGMSGLARHGFDEYLQSYIGSGGQLLGICLGMQLLLSDGKEGRETRGLGFIEGSVIPLEPSVNCRVPHMGWNDVHGDDMADIAIFDGIKTGSSCYFVHSYHAVPRGDVKRVYTDYCDREIVAAYQMNNLFGVQFHPEKSQLVGMKLLENFLNAKTD